MIQKMFLRRISMNCIKVGLEGEKPSLLQSKTIGDMIPNSITDLVETFINGLGSYK